MKPNTPVMDVFSYLAYETVGQVGKESVLFSNTVKPLVMDTLIVKDTSVIQTLGSGFSMSIMLEVLLYFLLVLYDFSDG